MNPLTAGIPVPPPPQTLPVGAGMFMAQAGASIKLADGSEWQLTGTAVPFDGRYGKAAKLRHLQVFGATKTAPGGARNIPAASGGSYANNGGNTAVVLPTVTNGEVLTTVDGGASFTAYTLPSFATLVRQVVWAGTRFVAAGKPGTEFRASHSADGISWAAFGTYGAGSISGDSSITLAVNPANNVVGAFTQTSIAGASLWKCTVDSTFAAVAGSPAVTGGAAQGLACDGTFFVGVSTTTIVRANADLTAISSSYAKPFSQGVASTSGHSIAALRNGTWIITLDTAGVYAWTNDITTDSSWRVITFPSVSAAHAPIANQRIYSDGTYFYMPLAGSVYRSADGLLWERFSMSVISSGTTYAVYPIGTGLIAFTIGASTAQYLHSLSLATPEYVGTNYLTASDSGSNAAALYYRVR